MVVMSNYNPNRTSCVDPRAYDSEPAARWKSITPETPALDSRLRYGVIGKRVCRIEYFRHVGHDKVAARIYDERRCKWQWANTYVMKVFETALEATTYARSMKGKSRYHHYDPEELKDY